MSGIRVPEPFLERFDELVLETTTLQAKYDSFSASVHNEQKQLIARAKTLWAQAISEMGLEGEWRYEKGLIYPVEKEKGNGL